MNDNTSDTLQSIKDRQGFTGVNKEIDKEDAFKPDYSDRHIKDTNIHLQPSHPMENNEGEIDQTRKI